MRLVTAFRPPSTARRAPPSFLLGRVSVAALARSRQGSAPASRAPLASGGPCGPTCSSSSLWP
eukprot:12132135-Alexandrium_andersonii.AAC.1